MGWKRSTRATAEGVPAAIVATEGPRETTATAEAEGIIPAAATPRRHGGDLVSNLEATGRLPEFGE